ncbi:MAG TPA: adenosylhomocysteinase [Methanocorpusculum sp.]|nr:adenosylhomocysteinase [Methanocorpusculum sp.]HJJ39732.1 adenosylhomocysteinase [Methanocorpusculum sp.]HJJ49341.1 adenosylhomocysteinase [Methanocorpusculum sp.]HJJ56615.1 adenosylhomocysteinase [Methanocorpusculum sp.]
MVHTGEQKIQWASQYMPVLQAIRKRFEKEKPLAGHRVGMALHVEAKTACLVRTLAAGGAEVSITGCNPLSTQDDVAEALRLSGIPCYAKRGCTTEEYYDAIDKVLDIKPTVTIDDGMDLINRVHTVRRDAMDTLIGACEETTTGIHRLIAMEAEGKLEFPVIDVNDTPMKHYFDNVHGTGESALASIMLTTNCLVAGKHVVVAGYGYCGRGVATKARALGARVIVTEVDPRKALQAHFDGFDVLKMAEAAPIGDLFITTTGNCSIITGEHFPLLKDGALLCNSGHFNNEITIPWLEEHATETDHRDGIDTYIINGKKIHVLAEGRLVNLSTPKGMGHPIEVMDLSFAVQALSVEYMVKNGKNLKAGVHEVPTDIDEFIARLKLESVGASVDELTPEQIEYMNSWNHGT